MVATPLPLGLRITLIVVLACPMAVSAALLADWPWVAIVVGVGWLAVALIDRGRTGWGWFLLIVPIGLGPCTTFVSHGDNPCEEHVYSDVPHVSEPVARQLPPGRQCRVELAGGRTVHDRGGLIAWPFVVGMSWFALAVAALFARRPRWYVRVAIVTVTWFPATWILWS